MRSMTSCGDKFGRGMPATNYVATLPRSFSVNSSKSDDNDDLRELIRAASTRSLANRIDINSLYLQQRMIKQQPSNLVINGSNGMPPRSCSVGMGMIDEEKPSVFGDDNMNMMPKVMYPRSRSHAVNRRSVLF